MPIRSTLLIAVAFLISACNTNVLVTSEEILVSPDEELALVILNVDPGTRGRENWIHISIQPRIERGSNKLYQIRENILKVRGRGDVNGSWTSERKLQIGLDASLLTSGVPKPKTVEGVLVQFHRISSP